MSLKDYKDCHESERVFIIGNGPSLADAPFKQLQDEYTIATNRINEIFDQTDWRPTYYAYTKNLGDRKEDVDEVIEAGSTCFINSDYENIFGELKNIEYLDVTFPGNDKRIDCYNDPDVPEKAKGYWSDDLTCSVYYYNMSLFPLFQIVHYMGFENVYLVGCDLGMDSDHVLFPSAGDPYLYLEEHMDDQSIPTLGMYCSYISGSESTIKSVLNVIYFSTGSPLILFSDANNPYTFAKEEQNNDNRFIKYIDYVCKSNSPIKSSLNGLYALISSSIPRIAGNNYHFTEDYTRSKKVVSGEDDRQRRAHSLAKKKLESRNVSIYNATAGGELEIYPRVDIENLLKV